MRDCKGALIGFGEVFRYQGQVCTQITRFPAQTAAWESSSVTRGGVPCPTKVLVLADDNVVVSAPVLGVSQRITIRALDEDGQELASATRVVSPIMSRLRSMSTSVRRRDKTSWLRSKVRELDESESALGDFDLDAVDYSDNRWWDCLYATLTLTNDRKTLEGLRPKLHAILFSGEEVSSSDIVVMGDAIQVADEGDPCGEAVRKIRFAVKIADDEMAVCLWVEFEGTDEPGPFVELEPYVLHALRVRESMGKIPVERSAEYETWFFAHRSGAHQLELQRRVQESFEVRPLFSVVIPLYHTPVNFLRDVLDSLIEQSYPRLEIILVNSTPEDEPMTQCVSEYAESDDRIRVVVLDANKGITENTNEGIAVATGDFVCFMDHDDMIERDLFYWYAREVNEHPGVNLMYCDEDLLIDGHYEHPFFKPDWSEVFLESNNYVCHLLAVRRSCLDAIEKPTKEFDGAQDHNMSLAVGELPGEVRHVNRVLYHWRSHANSTAQNADEKPESYAAGKLAIDKHYERIGFSCEARSISNLPHCYSAVLAQRSFDDVSVILWGEGDFVWDEETSPVRETIYVSRENGETWPQAIGRAATLATGEYTLLVSGDVQAFSEDMLNTLRSYVERKSIEVAAPAIWYPNETLRELGLGLMSDRGVVPIGRTYAARHPFGRSYNCLPHDVQAVDCTCLMTRRSRLGSLGESGLANMTLACVDMCLRARDEGKSVIVLPTCHAVVRMDASDLGLNASESVKAYIREWSAFVELWSKHIGSDPFYGRELSDDGLFRLRDDKGWVVPERLRMRILQKLVY